MGVGFGVIAAGSPALAADRAYELVTPPGSTARALPGTGLTTPQGGVVCYDAENAAAGAVENGLIAADGYCSWRTASGWETKWITGPGIAETRGGYGSTIYFAAPDASRVVFGSDTGIYPDFGGDPPGGTLAATQSAFLWEGGGMPRWLSPTSEPLPDPLVQRLPLAASDDVRRGVFESGLQLVPQDANSVADVYEWTPDGIRLVSRDASGAAVGGLAPRDGTGVAQPGTMSRDGSRIFFHHAGRLAGDAPDILQSVFMREGDTVRHVSPRRGGDVPQRVDFVGASDDGGIVYLQTAERLTPEPKEFGTAIYRYDVASDRLSLVATDPAEVTFISTSADGSTVVYRTGGFLAVGDLLVARDGGVSRLGTLDVMDVIDVNTAGSFDSGKRGLRIAADGSVIVFSAWGSMGDETSSGRRQVYAWTPDHGVRRVSATPGGDPAAGDADVGNFSVSNDLIPRNVGTANTLRKYPNLGRVLTDDGRAYFETIEQLVPQDINDYVDVYEWDGAGVRLISPGTQRAHAFYHDNSVDGDTVFFTTSARLIPELDRNEVNDLYAARVGGGFPLAPTPPACEGDGCQGPPAPPAVIPPSGTEVFNGPDDKTDPPPAVARHSVLRITAKQRRSFARSGLIVLRVRASERGVLTATANARLRRRAVRVGQSTVAVRRPGTVRVPLGISRRARNVLKAKRRLRVTIAVMYSESDTTVRRVVVLRG